MSHLIQNIVLQQRNFIPIDLQTRFHACKRVKESHWKISISPLFITSEDHRFLLIANCT